tara:strand:+ start:107 stop:484 length:378 start_codon:yes stop_codon:yes gene_type:complete
MSTLKVATIQDTSGNNSSTPAQVAQGRAKAWINFNGTGTVSIRDDFNFSSVTDNGTGLYTLNFTSALANANYAVVPGGTRDLPESSRCFPANIDQISTSSFDLSTHNDGSTSVDWELVTCAVFGD